MKKHNTEAATWVRLSPENKAKAVTVAESEGRSLSNYVARLILQDLERRERERKNDKS